MDWVSGSMEWTGIHEMRRSGEVNGLFKWAISAQGVFSKIMFRYAGQPFILLRPECRFRINWLGKIGLNYPITGTLKKMIIGGT